MTTVAVVDCGMGNLHSVIAGVRRSKPDTTVTVAATAAAIDRADKVIFPGDGNFGACVREIDTRNLRQSLISAAKTKPFFGICVGMQVLFAGSEEAPGDAGLGLFSATIRQLPKKSGLKVPHMGWNTARYGASHPLLDSAASEDYFYFIHSYYAPAGPWSLMLTEYGVTFSAAIAEKKLIATQFHPEKSGSRGIRLLQKFLNQ